MVKKSTSKPSPNQRKKWLNLLQPYVENQDNNSKNKEKYRVVIDTNVLVSAVFFGGKPEQVVKHALKNQSIILSDYIVEEFMSYAKDIRPKMPHKFVRTLRQKLESYCYSDDAIVQDDAVRDDSGDMPILKLAVRQNALIVTGDRDLLEHEGSTRISAITTQEYLELFDN